MIESSENSKSGKDILKNELEITKNNILVFNYNEIIYFVLIV